MNIPCIKKEFTVDEYNKYEAKLLSASAVLLICSILTEETIKKYIGICATHGLTALVETHNEDEVRIAVRAGARVIGVNNRNLKGYTVDTENSRKLRSIIPDSAVFVSESGIQNADDINALREIGADAVLIGDTLMRAIDKTAMLAERKGKAI